MFLNKDGSYFYNNNPQYTDVMFDFKGLKTEQQAGILNQKDQNTGLGTVLMINQEAWGLVDQKTGQSIFDRPQKTSLQAPNELYFFYFSNN